jgi:hypothetical protein
MRDEGPVGTAAFITLFQASLFADCRNGIKVRTVKTDSSSG